MVKDSPPVFMPRGVPEDVSNQTLRDYAALLDDKLAKYYATLDEVYQKRLQYITDRAKWTWVSDPDHYNASWLTANELEEVCNQFELKEGQDPYLCQYRSIVAMLKVLNLGVDENSRVIFWFHG